MGEDRIILGIDPGTTVLGYGLVQVVQGKISLVNFGVVQLHKLGNHPDKLKRILDRLNGLIEEFKPSEMAIEAPFFGKNVQSMLKLGRAQGVAIAACLNRDIPFEEYSPRRIKQSITGIEMANALWREGEAAEGKSWSELKPASEELRDHLLHLIASHHGTKEFGSPVAPKTPEAFLLHHIDNMDAKIEMLRLSYARGKEETTGLLEAHRPLEGPLPWPISGRVVEPGVDA